MSVLTGYYPDLQALDRISEYMEEASAGRTKAHHIWTEEIKSRVYDDIERIRTSDVLLNVLRQRFPDTRITNVREADELYYAVSPIIAQGSDRSLVDYHYDAPFAAVETGVRFYRIIIACNENMNVSTIFPHDNVSVIMNTGDFHGLDYNKDWHGVEGAIPINTYRVLMKLHYIVVPNVKGAGSPDEVITKFLNVSWTKISREFMRMSAEPQNILEKAMGGIVNTSRTYFNKV